MSAPITDAKIDEMLRKEPPKKRQRPRMSVEKYRELRKTAIITLAVCMVAAILLGGLRSRYSAKRKAEKLFYKGNEYSIESLLEDIEGSAKNYTVVTGRVLGETAPETEALADAYSALDKAKSVNEKHDAWQELLDCVDDAYYTMEGHEMSDKDSRYRETLREDIISTSRQIRHSAEEYNKKAAAVNEKLAHSWLPGTESLPIFN